MLCTYTRLNIIIIIIIINKNNNNKTSSTTTILLYLHSHYFIIDIQIGVLCLIPVLLSAVRHQACARDPIEGIRPLRETAVEEHQGQEAHAGRRIPPDRTTLELSQRHGNEVPYVLRNNYNNGLQLVRLNAPFFICLYVLSFQIISTIPYVFLLFESSLPCITSSTDHIIHHIFTAHSIS